MSHLLSLVAGMLAIAAGLATAADGQSVDEHFAQVRARGLGLNLYIDHCASCHGRSGRGDGPFAEDMTVRPSDLTHMAERNGWVFPAVAVAHAIEGSDPAHRAGDMPRWGDIFRADAGEATAKQRLEALTLYLEFMQTRPPRPRR